MAKSTEANDLSFQKLFRRSEMASSNGFLE
jgi:hypothetical protein